MPPFRTVCAVSGFFEVVRPDGLAFTDWDSWDLWGHICPRSAVADIGDSLAGDAEFLGKGLIGRCGLKDVDDVSWGELDWSLRHLIVGSLTSE